MSKVLIVDDEYSIVEILRLFLEGEGYEVMTAYNGQEGLVRLAEQQPDLVLCDIMMPMLDGRGMCRQMQANDVYRSIPLIFMSAVFTSSQLAGCSYTDLIIKPFDLDTLLQTIEHHTSSQYNGH